MISSGAILIKHYSLLREALFTSGRLKLNLRNLSSSPLLLSSPPPDYNRFLRVAYGGVDTLSAPR